MFSAGAGGGASANPVAPPTSASDAVQKFFELSRITLIILEDPFWNIYAT